MRDLLSTRKAKALAALLAFGTLAGCLWGLTFTSLFGAESLVVEGPVSLTEEEVLSLAGVARGTNVFHLDEAATESSLESSPWILDATVTKDLPSTVVISVIERSPILATDDGLAVAGDGVVLPGAQVDGLPKVRGSVTLSDEARTAAAQAMQSMAPVVRVKVASILALVNDELILELRSGTSVSWGRPGEEEEKAAALRAVLVWAGQQQLTPDTIDVSVPTAPTATLPDGTAVAV